ncbi:DUF1992 domain-containing protein [Neobacillus notoginsengisoli]|uniref:DUF1992 domain-containing protein n=1 Tax=Neobacillus notoginsengisoli TaxID=1578198 RepID=A0A417YW25_9BACI|nr:DUF1992 domain-containing protein [Neobacillus notoginsengisoli]RHW41555.1 DUF1992 domain-containing protein [Neobacillus notoginsengisoli]
MDYFQIISEDRIKKAYKDGEFANLPGFGKPLPPDELANIPEDIRMAYRILKNGGYTEEATKLRQEIVAIENLIAESADEVERANMQKKLNQKLLRYNSIMSRRGEQTNSSIFKNYSQKVMKKLT